MKTDRNTICAGSSWVWGPPLVFLALAGIITLLGINHDLFVSINSVSRFTGDTIWAVLTFFGDGLVSFVILFPLIYRRPRLIWAVAIAAVLFAIFGQAIKNITQMPRPPQVLSTQDFHLIGPDLRYNSFPSGHSSMIFNLAGVFALTTPRTWLRWLLLPAAGLVAVSRVVVGVHWPVDVLAGAAFGWIAVWAGLRLAEHSRWGWTGWGRKILGAVLLSACVVLFFEDFTGCAPIIGFQRAVAVLFFLWGGYNYLRVWTRNETG
jgi:membrane-associated phospholipid phosphatase